jgi:hypothetical protein
LSETAGARAWRGPWRGRAAVLGGLLLWPLVLPFDGVWAASRWPWAPWLTTTAAWLYFAALHRAAPARLRHALVSGIVIATAGEAFFSLALGMYEYRQKAIPLYVPPGHSILYATVFWFSRDGAVRRHAADWSVGLYFVATAYSAWWLVRQGDVYGWLGFAVFSAVIVVARESRVFFLAMYVLVAFLEQVGTRAGCWSWPPVLLGRFPAIPSANPPSGIASFYFGLDVLVTLAYLRARPGLVAARARRRARRLTPLPPRAPSTVPPAALPSPAHP